MKEKRNLAATAHLYNLVAFLSVLIAIVILAMNGKALDAAIMVGLIGVLGSFRPWGTQSPQDGTKVEIDQPKDNPVPVESRDEV